ncbi:hypothetical protein DFR58_13325 [Anaerobacterium chartisolvens]|uniref:Fibronectin type-III domain-containing protein n=1 Tax=Anaerobacterium chartisolvens TaxID=1297424 RepID=A0A369ANN3_9FIRM|nr:fibronectin type III domain-containing protein [Anaerobacterium chartisolvens]RCX09886.1 hypothetical protein DFR58_13325 [Anaerobacterium chartisolvens]
MRKRGTAKIFVGLLAMIMVMSVLCVNAFAATVGEQLTSPEEGWKRIDDKDSSIIYSDGFKLDTNDVLYNRGHHYSTSPTTGKFIKFKFYGTKLRIIDTIYSNRLKNGCTIRIDGEPEFYNIYEQTSIIKRQYIVYEKLDLPLSAHRVEIIFNEDSSNGSYFSLDAIDIDDTGYMMDYNQPANLTATPGNAAVALSWDAVEDAVSYNIKRSATAGGPYATIATGVTDTAYTDATVTNGITYYYVVSAVTASGQSANSNEASATPEAPPAIGNSAILEITVTTGAIKEYDVTAAELQDFLSWYDGSSSGADKAYYIFTKKNNIVPFLSRKEYLAFDKIVSFEVKEYEK